MCDFDDTRRCTDDYNKVEDDEKLDKSMKSIIRLTWCENTLTKNMSDTAKVVPFYETKQKGMMLYVNKTSLNEGFRNCFHYHNHINGTSEHLDTSIRYNIAYLNEDNSDTCSSGEIRWSSSSTFVDVEDFDEVLTFNVSMNSSKYTSDFDNMMVNLMCILEPSEKHKYTKNDDGFKRRAKYLFVQPFSVPILKIPTTSETTLAVTIAIPLIILASLLSFVFIFLQRRRAKYLKGSCRNIQNIVDTNNIQSSNESATEDESNWTNQHNENCPEENFDTSISSCCVDCRAISELPSTLTETPDMLYPRCIVSMEGDLGIGNFGSVFKGSLKMGKAR